MGRQRRSPPCRRAAACGSSRASGAEGLAHRPRRPTTSASWTRRTTLNPVARGGGCWCRPAVEPLTIQRSPCQWTWAPRWRFVLTLPTRQHTSRPLVLHARSPATQRRLNRGPRGDYGTTGGHKSECPARVLYSDLTGQPGHRSYLGLALRDKHPKGQKHDP
jgi:hypothetical protein